MVEGYFTRALWWVRAVLVLVLAAAGVLELGTPARASSEPPSRSVAMTGPAVLESAVLGRRHPLMSGVDSSAYRGKFYRSSQEPVRRCILRRESNGHYFSTSPAGYFGGYQMTLPLARGATWMMLPELKRVHGKSLGRQVARLLRRTDPHRWARRYQDMAFYTVYNWEGPGSGARHWAGGRWRC